MKDIKRISEINIEDTPKNTIAYYWLDFITGPLGTSISLPVMVARGNQDSPILGLTAAVHGNELNGISVIQRLFRDLEVEALSGVIIAIPVVNIPAFIRKKRRFNDGVDLNHIMPGVEDGNVSQVYAHRFIKRVIPHFDYLMDLHTASMGRVNSYYIRADMETEITRKLALLQNAQIIVNNSPSDGTLRGAVEEMGIPAITLEVGNPNTFQRKLIRSGVVGVHNVLSFLNMTDDEIIPAEHTTVLCKHSYWIYTRAGGLLVIYADLTEIVEQNQKIASLYDVFGRLVEDYFAPERGIVIGKSISPVNQSGGRIIHLGILD